MKNIERPEVIKRFAYNIYNGYLTLDLEQFGFPNTSSSEDEILQWLNAEYVEPHKWEPWELEAMRNIPKRIVYLERRKDNKLPRALQKEDCYSDHGICTQINFPSLKNEKIDIDAELERNGMHR